MSIHSVFTEVVEKFPPSAATTALVQLPAAAQ
jgi:hypothetical protein